jgi:hypothetical protein
MNPIVIVLAVITITSLGQLGWLRLPLHHSSRCSPHGRRSILRRLRLVLSLLLQLTVLSLSAVAVVTSAAAALLLVVVVAAAAAASAALAVVVVAAVAVALRLTPVCYVVSRSRCELSGTVSSSCR